MDLLRFAAVATFVVGMAMASLAIVGLIRSRRDAAGRLLALGVVYLGMFVAVVGAELLLLALIGDERLPVIAGVPPMLLLGFTAIRLRLAASRSFAQAQAARQVTLRDAD